MMGKKVFLFKKKKKKIFFGIVVYEVREKESVKERRH